MYKWRKT